MMPEEMTAALLEENARLRAEHAAIACFAENVV
jgi:hypothetical protein